MLMPVAAGAMFDAIGKVQISGDVAGADHVLERLDHAAAVMEARPRASTARCPRDCSGGKVPTTPAVDADVVGNAAEVHVNLGTQHVRHQHLIVVHPQRRRPMGDSVCMRGRVGMVRTVRPAFRPGRKMQRAALVGNLDESRGTPMRAKCDFACRGFCR
jgi:hypothetical protein